VKFLGGRSAHLDLGRLKLRFFRQQAKHDRLISTGGQSFLR